MAFDPGQFQFAPLAAPQPAADAFNFSFAPPATGQQQAAPSFGFGGGGSGTDFTFNAGALGAAASTGPAFSFGTDSAFNFAASTGSASAGGFDFSALGGGSTGQSLWAQPSYSYQPSASAYPLDEDTVERRFEALVAAYNPAHVNCKFRFMFYNKVNPSEVHKYRPPANANLKLYQQAVQNNPDPKNLVPTQITGFDDLVKRIKQQDIAHTEYQNKLNEIRHQIVEMQNKHELIKKQEIERIRRVLLQQSHRLLSLMTKIESDRARDFPLLNTEVDFRRKLESLKRKLTKPAARVTELSVAVKQVEDRPTADGGAHLLTLDAENADKLYSFLDTQRTALAYLTSTTKKDTNDVNTCINGLQNLKTPGS